MGTVRAARVELVGLHQCFHHLTVLTDTVLCHAQGVENIGIVRN
jgi:hypothetical protein